MVTELKAIDIAKIALKKEGFSFLESTGNAIYRDRKLAVGDEKKGWVVSFKLDTDVEIEPDIVFVHVSDPDAKVFIPNLL